MCTREKEFTIRGTDDCLARGYDRTGFFEVDTGDQPSWTVQLTEFADQAPMQPLQSRVPMLQTPPAAGRPGSADASAPKPQLMRRLRRTKIVATLGPASSDRSVIASLFQAGADVFRINMSHTSARAHARAGGVDPRGGNRVRPADRDPGRPAGTQAAGRQLRGQSGDAQDRRHLRARCRSDARATPRACTCRIPKSSRPSSPATRCCSTTARCGSSPPRSTTNASSRASRSAASCPTARA